MDFSKEIYFLIFEKFTSIHDLHHCSLVNKNWHSIASDPSFYKEIEFYSDKQIKTFINNNPTIGQHVKKILIINNGIVLFKDNINDLQRCCPNITSIQYSYPAQHKFDIIGKWDKLTHLPSWHSEPVIRCLEHYKNTLKYLAFFIKNEDARLLKERILSPELYYIRNLLYLEKLKLEFRDIYNLSVLDLIHSTCPQVKELNTCDLQIDKYQLPLSLSSMTVFYRHHQHQWDNISTLHFKDITINDPLFFTYLSYNYPNLESLTLDDIDYTNNEDEDFDKIDDPDSVIYKYRASIEQMIIHLSSQLKKLHISCDTPEFIWPNNKILTHLHLNPSAKLKDLKWPSVIYPYKVEKRLDEYEFQYLQSDIKPIGFIQYLESLSISVPFICKYTLSYLLNNNQNIFPHLKELSVSSIQSPYSKARFFLYDWLNGFPNLISLAMNGLDIITIEPFISNMEQQQQKQSHYKLLKIYIKHCDIHLEGGFSQLCQRCSQLNHLECKYSVYFNLSQINVDENEHKIMEKIKNNFSSFFNQYTLLYAPHIIFKTLIVIDLEFVMGYLLLETKMLVSTNNHYISHIKIMDENEFLGHGDEESDRRIQAFIGIHVLDIEKYSSDEHWYIY